MRSMKSKFGLPLSLSGLLLAATVHAATITPNITTDPALVGPNTGTDCSLRYAIESINDGTDFEGGCLAVSTGTLGTGDTIVLGADTYVLTLSGEETNNATGDLNVLNDVAIEGAGSNATTIDASGIGGGDRVITFYYLSSNDSLTGVTVTGGDVRSLGDSNGGGINISAQNTTLEDVRVVDNFANSGGGIFTEEIEGEPAVLINNSTIAGNEAVSGGGIFILEGTVGISNSTISGNDAVDGNGGGIFIEEFALFLTNSTISGNTAASSGGGIFTVSSGGANGLKGAYNVTITLNTASGDGGGIASTDFPAPQGLVQFPIRIFNSIIAANTSESNGQDCANGFFPTGGYNLIGQIDPSDGCTDFVDGVNNDRVGTTATPINPQLGPLADNGGPTQTHALLVGSVAIDGANPNGCQAADVAAFINDGSETFTTLTTDQRGEPRPVAVLDPNVAICDIGAYEFQVVVPTPTPTPTPLVTPTPPPFQGFVEGSGCSLNPASAAAASGSLWIALGLMAGFLGLKKKTRD